MGRKLCCVGRGGGEWIGDGNTHIWVSLTEGRTSPILGIGVAGSAVTIDWGDGTTPDVLTGAFGSKWTPAHEYAKAGNYVITLKGKFVLNGSGDTYGGASILRYSTGSDKRNAAYQNAVQKVELNNVSAIGANAFADCNSLTSINIPDSVTSINSNAFKSCYLLSNIHIPNGVTSIGTGAFSYCYGLASVNIPDGVTSIGDYAFYNCNRLINVRMPNGVTSIGTGAFSNCTMLTFVDFTKHTAVPTLSGTSAFTSIPDDCEIRVPAALADEWKAATNWATYADKIVGV